MTDVVLTVRSDPAWNRAGIDLANASETDLRYRFLLGDVGLRIGDADFSTHWGWIPLLDFVHGLSALLSRLPTSQRETFEFTESGAELRFDLNDGDVEVRSNFVGAIGHAPLDVMQHAVRKLADEVLLAARREAPEIDANPAFERIARDLTLPEK